MRVVPQALGRLHRKEDLSVVMIVFHVQTEKSVTRQVISGPCHSVFPLMLKFWMQFPSKGFK